MTSNYYIRAMNRRGLPVLAALALFGGSSVLRAAGCAEIEDRRHAAAQDIAVIERYLGFSHYQRLFSFDDKHNPEFASEGTARRLIARAWRVLLSRLREEPSQVDSYREKSLLSISTGTPSRAVFANHSSGPYGRLKVDEGALSGLEVGRDKLVFFHGTNCLAMNSIFENGIDLRRGNGELGQGFYLTTSFKQAVEWTRVKGSFIRGNENCAAILRVVIQKRQIDAVYSARKFVGFKGIGTVDRTNFFRNFTSGNLRLYVLGAAPESPKAEDVDLISGPSIKAEGVFDQYNFLPTKSNGALFSRESHSISMTYSKLNPDKESTN